MNYFIILFVLLNRIKFHTKIIVKIFFYEEVLMKIHLIPTHKYRHRRYPLYFFLIIISCLFIFYLFLISPNLTRKKALEPFRHRYFAHRGLFDNTSGVPENSLAAFKEAINYDYGIELDVQLTKDKVPVVIHDYNLQRVCNKSIKVASLTVNELKDYPLFDSSECIPTLSSALSLIDGQVPVIIELKVGLTYKETCKQVAKVLENYQGDYCIMSFSSLALSWFKSHYPHILRGQLATNFFKDSMNSTPTLKLLLSYLMLNRLSKPDFIAYNKRYLCNFSLLICEHLFHTPVALWTITDEAELDALSPYYDMLIFDNFNPLSKK